MVNLVFSRHIEKQPRALSLPPWFTSCSSDVSGIQFYYLSQFTAKHLPAGLIQFFSFCKHYLQGALHMIQIVGQCMYNDQGDNTKCNYVKQSFESFTTVHRHNNAYPFFSKNSTLPFYLHNPFIQGYSDFTTTFPQKKTSERNNHV